MTVKQILFFYMNFLYNELFYEVSIQFKCWKEIDILLINSNLLLLLLKSYLSSNKNIYLNLFQRFMINVYIAFSFFMQKLFKKRLCIFCYIYLFFINTRAKLIMLGVVLYYHMNINVLLKGFRNFIFNKNC